MVELTDELIAAWNNRKGPAVFATVDKAGIPNIIYVGAVRLFGKDRVVIADNYFAKTRKNIQTHSYGAILFITEDDKAYQLKGTIEYHESGPIFDDMKTWNSEKHPGHAAAALCIEEAYSGAEKIL